MDIQIIPDSKKWYTAMIKELAITTQWDTWDELILNIREALQCYAEAEEKAKQISIFHNKKLRFYFDMESLAYAY